MSGGVPAGEKPSTLCLACCRTLKEHGTKRQCPETTYFIANRATPTPPIEGRDADVERVKLPGLATYWLLDSARILRSNGSDMHATEIEAIAAALQALGERG